MTWSVLLELLRVGEEIAPRIVPFLGRSLVLGCALLLVSLLLHSRSAALVHSYWRMSLLAFAMLTAWICLPTPPTGSVFSIESASFDVTASGVAAESVRRAEAARTFETDFARLAPPIGLVWLAGTVFFVGRWLIALVLLAGRRARSSDAGPHLLTVFEDCKEKVGGCSAAVVRVESQSQSPATWGLFRPTVVFPEHWSRCKESDLRMAMYHELAHVRRSDATFLAGATLIRSMHWFNPLAWWACSRLIESAEKACDDVALEHAGRPIAYASLLGSLAETLAKTRSESTIGALSIVRSGSQGRIVSRVAAILDPAQQRKSPTATSRLALLGTTLATLALVVVFGPGEVSGLEASPRQITLDLRVVEFLVDPANSSLATGELSAELEQQELDHQLLTRQAAGELRLVSAPRVTVLEGQTAKVSSGITDPEPPATVRLELVARIMPSSLIRLQGDLEITRSLDADVAPGSGERFVLEVEDGAAARFVSTSPAAGEQRRIVLFARPRVKAEDVANRSAIRYSGPPMTFSLRDEDLVETLLMFARVGDKRFEIAEGVEGTVSVDLRGVPWNLALDQILGSTGLEKKVINESTIRIVPIEE